MSAAPVAIVLANRAMPEFPAESRSPIIPEPTTAANKKPVPMNSAATRRIKSNQFPPLSAAPQNHGHIRQVKCDPSISKHICQLTYDWGRAKIAL
jgi:hypothetical protein